MCCALPLRGDATFTALTEGAQTIEPCLRGEPGAGERGAIERAFDVRGGRARLLNSANQSAAQFVHQCFRALAVLTRAGATGLAGWGEIRMKTGQL